MDLDNNFYLFRFKYDINYSKVLHEGPWFIGQNFLSIRHWEPKFCADRAECKETALRVRLPRLPPEFYNLKTLTCIGNLLGRTLKVDSHTSDALRSQFASICVQVTIHNPLVTITALGHHTLRIIYEGIN